MPNLGDPNIDLTKLSNSSHLIGGKSYDTESLINSISMISMKINSTNVEYVKNFTSEGLSKESRIDLIRNLKNELGSDVFEFSTCNRVLYVGFGTTCDELERCVMSIFNQDLSLDIDFTIKHSEKLIKSGLHGAIFFGSTGCSQLISLNEKKNLIDKIKKQYPNLFLRNQS